MWLAKAERVRSSRVYLKAKTHRNVKTGSNQNKGVNTDKPVQNGKGGKHSGKRLVSALPLPKVAAFFILLFLNSKLQIDGKDN